MDLKLPQRGANRANELAAFADALKEIRAQIGFKLSSRGWCYQLESYRLINKKVTKMNLEEPPPQYKLRVMASDKFSIQNNTIHNDFTGQSATIDDIIQTHYI